MTRPAPASAPELAAVAERARALAGEAGLSVSDYLVRQALGRPVAARSIDRAQTELVRVGTNLNRLVRRAHEAEALAALSRVDGRRRGGSGSGRAARPGSGGAEVFGVGVGTTARVGGGTRLRP